jgi:hypothetical protein
METVNMIISKFNSGHEWGQEDVYTDHFVNLSTWCNSKELLSLALANRTNVISVLYK